MQHQERTWRKWL